MKEARMLVQLITYHALLQREDLKLQQEDTPTLIMAMTEHLTNLYLEKMVVGEMGEEDDE